MLMHEKTCVIPLFYYVYVTYCLPIDIKISQTGIKVITRQGFTFSTHGENGKMWQGRTAVLTHYKPS